MEAVLQSVPGFFQIVNIVVLFSALFLFTSTIASHLLEALVGWWNSRGNQLRARLEAALGKDAADAIYDDPLIKSISTYKKARRRGNDSNGESSSNGTYYPPSYIEPEIFADVLKRLSETHESVKANGVITELQRAATNASTKLEPKIIEWFKAINDHQNGVYTRWTFLRLFGIGLFLAIAMDIDTAHIAGTLWKNPAQAEQAAKALDEVEKLGNAKQLNDEQRKKLKESIAATYERLRTIDPPNYAWQELPKDPKGWATKALGWWLTAIATSLGAQFWFNIMSEALKLRAAGRKPSAEGEKKDKDKDKDKDKNK